MLWVLFMTSALGHLLLVLVNDLVRSLAHRKVLFSSPSCSMKNWFMPSVRISSYGCMREVWRALAKR